MARAQAVFDRVTQANGVDYRSDIFEGQVFAPNTVHPLGGCVRGMATDGYGRVNGYDKLYVNDASLLPATWAATCSCRSPHSPSATSRESCRGTADRPAIAASVKPCVLPWSSSVSS
ncbi:hypothetical protein [Mycobacterium sp. URHB0021]